MALKRPRWKPGTVVTLEHTSGVLKDNPLGDPYVRKLALWLPPQYDTGAVAEDAASRCCSIWWDSRARAWRMWRGRISATTSPSAPRDWFTRAGWDRRSSFSQIALRRSAATSTLTRARSAATPTI